MHDEEAKSVPQTAYDDLTSNNNQVTTTGSSHLVTQATAKEREGSDEEV